MTENMMQGTITLKAEGEVRDADGNLLSTSEVTFLDIDASTLPPEVVQAIINQQEAQND